MRKSAGFTLLEVLIALTILSGVALFVIRAVGDGARDIGDNGWKDHAMRLGRAKLIQLVQQGIKGGSEGTFAPDYPDLYWRAVIISIGEAPGRKLELTLREGSHELLLERILIP